jgi:hypothetical protein
MSDQRASVGTSTGNNDSVSEKSSFIPSWLKIGVLAACSATVVANLIKRHVRQHRQQSQPNALIPNPILAAAQFTIENCWKLSAEYVESLKHIELGSQQCRQLFALDFFDYHAAPFQSGTALPIKNYFLNHGSYGAVPQAILQHQWALEAWMETHPDRWFRQRSVCFL